MTKIEEEIAQYPETGIINLYMGTKFMLTPEMLGFFNGYLLSYRDYPDLEIVKEFSEKFDILEEVAKRIERDYVILNRSRIYKRIEKFLKQGIERQEIEKQIQGDFGLDSINAEKYVRRASIDYYCDSFMIRGNECK